MTCGAFVQSVFMSIRVIGISDALRWQDRGRRNPGGMMRNPTIGLLAPAVRGLVFQKSLPITQAAIHRVVAGGFVASDPYLGD